jgi:RecG-like helicase
VNSKFLRDKVKFALENVEIEEFLPEKILNKYNFKNLSETLKEIHFPKLHRLARYHGR